MSAILESCNYSGLSTSVVLHIGSICSLKIYSFSLIINTFLALHIALTMGKLHFARFRNCQTHMAFVNVGVACEILHPDNQGSDNRGCTAFLPVCYSNSDTIYKFASQVTKWKSYTFTSYKHFNNILPPPFYFLPLLSHPLTATSSPEVRVPLDFLMMRGGGSTALSFSYQLLEYIRITFF